MGGIRARATSLLLTQAQYNSYQNRSVTSKMTDPSEVNEPTLADQKMLALAWFRAQREYDHWYRGGLRFCHYYLSIYPQVPVPRIKLGEVQDCGNKSVAIYFTGQQSNRQVTGSMYDFIYRRWYHGTNTDLEFNVFLARPIRLKTTARPATSNILEDTLKVHLSLCSQLHERERILDAEDAATPTEMLLTSVRKDQHQFYRIQPLFRALLMFFDHPAPWLEEGKVQLIKTGVTTGLSQPISFEDIPTEEPYDPGASMITTDFVSAIEFILSLERREIAAGCVDYDGTTMDKFLGDSDLLAQSIGYESSTIPGPTSSWVTEEEMETWISQQNRKKRTTKYKTTMDYLFCQAVAIDARSSGKYDPPSDPGSSERSKGESDNI